MPRELKHFLIALPIIVLVALLISLWIGAGAPKASTGSSPSGDAEAINPDIARIAVLSPALAVIVRDLGLEDRIVARHGFDIVLDKSIPVAGDQAGIDYEALLAARPTHVLLQWGARDLPPRLLELADERGWLVEDHTLNSLTDIATTTQRIERRFDVEAARRLSPILAESWAPGEVDLAPVGTVLLLASTQPAGALGPGSYHHELLVSLGAIPAITDGAPWVELDAEDVLRLAPDAIVLLRPTGVAADESTWLQLRPQLGRIGELDIPAIADQRVVLIDDPLGLIPSTATADLAGELREVLERWAE